MRVSLLSCLLAFVCSVSATLEGQSCIAADRLTGVAITGATCTSDSRIRCEPGDALTFKPLLYAGPFTPATCPTQIAWQFGDGATLTSTDPTVGHTFSAAGKYYGKLTAMLPNIAQTYEFVLLVAAGTIDLSTAGPSIEEGQSATVSVTRTGNLSLPGTVDYLTTGALMPSSGTLSFAAGESHKDLTVQAPDDTISNEPRGGELVLRNPTGGWIFDNPYALNGDKRIGAWFSIQDNDQPAIHKCAQSTITVNESAGAALFELTRTGNLTSTTTGYVRIWGNWDLDTYGKFTTNFAPGETTRTLSIPLVNDHVYAGIQRTSVTCGGEGPGTSPATSEGTITVIDDEPFPTMVAPASLEVTETDAKQRVTIPISFVPPFLYPPDFRVQLTHGTTDSTDLELVSEWLHNAIELDITGDDLPEADERAVIQIAGAISKSIALTIRDDDRPPFPYTFEHDRYEFQEAEGGTVAVQRSGSLAAGASLVIRIRPVSGPPWGEPIPVVFAPGESSKEVSLALDDHFYTGTRTAILELELDGFVGATAALDVLDDEARPSLSIGDAIVREGTLDQRTRLEVPLTLTAPVGEAIRAAVVAAHITTSAGDVALLPQTVTISAGDLTGSAVFEIIGDIEPEPDETFSVTIATCCDGLASVARPTATVTILDDDGAPSETVYRLEVASHEAKESAKWFSVKVRRYGRVAGSTRATLKLTAQDSRVFLPRTVYFAPNEIERVEPFFIDDAAYSGNTTVRVELFGGDRLFGTESVTIVEDEQMPTVYITGSSALEGSDAAIPFELRIFPPSTRPISVHLHARSGTATNGYDFPPFDTDVTVPPLHSAYPVLVPILDDNAPEGDESVFVDITHADGASVFSPYVWGTIRDNESVYVRNEPNVLRGTETTITVEFPAPAPANDSIPFLAEPTILEGPLTIPVPKGARNVSFKAIARKTGTFTFSVGTPTFLPPKRIDATMTIFAPFAITMNPAGLETAPGTTTRVSYTALPAGTSVSVKSLDPQIAAVEHDLGGEGHAFIVYAVASGRTEIVLTLFGAAQGSTATLPVVVTGPPDPPTRNRSVRH